MGKPINRNERARMSQSFPSYLLLKKEAFRRTAISTSLRASSIAALPLLSVQSVVDLFLLFLAEFLESGIGAQGVPDLIEPKKGRRNGCSGVIQALRPIGRL